MLIELNLKEPALYIILLPQKQLILPSFSNFGIIAWIKTIHRLTENQVHDESGKC